MPADQFCNTLYTLIHTQTSDKVYKQFDALLTRASMTAPTIDRSKWGLGTEAKQGLDALIDIAGRIN